MDSTKVLDTDYTLTNPGGSGTVTFITAPANGTVVTISRTTVVTQGTDYDASPNVSSAALEASVDKLTLTVQDVQRLAQRAIKVPESESAAPTEWDKTSRAGKMVEFDSSGNPTFITKSSIINASGVTTAQAAAEAAATAAAASASTASTAATNATYAMNSANTQAVIAGNKATAADSSAATALGYANAAAASAASIGTSVTNAANSATAAANSASTATTASLTATTQASAAQTSATNAAASATSAASSVAAVATSATNAANSASAAATSATNAAASATSAASSASSISGSVSTAATHATNAANSATAAATSATNAATSATGAANSATAAATSATNAGASATTAANAAASASASVVSAAASAVAAQAVADSLGGTSGITAAINAASTSATNAATSATNSANSASAAASSAAAAAASATTASTASTNASSSATSAASSASTASSYLANSFIGGIAGASVPATASAAGRYYIITSAGTSQSKTWAVGDWAVYNGTSGSWTQVAAGTLTPSDSMARRSGLAPRGGIYFDGALQTAYVATRLPVAPGTAPLSVSFWIWNSGSASVYWGLTTALGGNSDSDIMLDSGGFTSSAPRVKSDTGAYSSARATDYTVPVNKWSHVVMTRSGTTVVVYVNGVQVLTDTNAVWGNSFTARWLNFGQHAFGLAYYCIFAYGQYFNVALSAADVLELFENGGTPPARYQWGSFSNQTSGTLAVGRRYRITTYVAGDSFTNVGAASNATGQEFTATATTPTTWTNASTLTRIGAAISIPMDEGAGFILRDVSTNKNHAFCTTTGATHVIPSVYTQRLRYTSDGTSTAQKLCGATSIPALSQILRVRARSQSGTPNLILGTASGGSQVVASVALSTTWKVLTIALTDGYLASNTDLWMTASTANVVELDIEWAPLSA